MLSRTFSHYVTDCVCVPISRLSLLLPDELLVHREPVVRKSGLSLVWTAFCPGDLPAHTGPGTPSSGYVEALEPCAMTLSKAFPSTALGEEDRTGCGRS